MDQAGAGHKPELGSRGHWVCGALESRYAACVLLRVETNLTE